ncbi:hypothetical protein RIF29_39565 [Crotalaria pallida]|uniref:Uncharacterized protein n=1 Tax=Crotalaria pallida TaxID=3830 RepID=A0AAN9HPQ6_CROPI
MTDTLKAHVNFLKSQGIARVSHHSLLFSKTASVHVALNDYGDSNALLLSLGICCLRSPLLSRFAPPISFSCGAASHAMTVATGRASLKLTTAEAYPAMDRASLKLTTVGAYPARDGA